MIEEVDRDVHLQVVRFEVGDSVELGAPFGFEFAEALLDSGEDSATGVVLGFESADEAILTIGDVVEGSAKSFKLGGSIGVSLMVNGAKVDSEQGASIGTEDALSEELGDGCKKRVFSDPDAGGVVGETLRDLAGVVEGWLTDSSFQPVAGAQTSSMN